MPWVKWDRCVGCKKCIEVCPTGAIYIKEDHAVIVDDECKRQGCRSCREICPIDSIFLGFESPPGRQGNALQ